MTNHLKAVPASAGTQARRPARGPLQYLLGVLFLIYLACGWRYVESLWMLVNIQTIALLAALLMVTGSALLAVGVARSLYNARLGQYFFLLAALQLGIAAPQIGNWGYKLSQGMLATLVFGISIAALGIFLAWKAGQSERH
ncbi:MAG: hypothetical protein V4631_07160 [Pseudomonadota bacterium]